VGEENKKAGSIQLGLRRVVAHGRCLRCGATDCELFITGIESEMLLANKLLAAECLCKNCTSIFLTGMVDACKAVWRQISAQDYTVETEDVYEKSRRDNALLEKEIIIQNAVKNASHYTLSTEGLEPVENECSEVDESGTGHGEQCEEITEDFGSAAETFYDFENTDDEADSDDCESEEEFPENHVEYDDDEFVPQFGSNDGEFEYDEAEQEFEPDSE
jgi:hypothetical protein